MCKFYIIFCPSCSLILGSVCYWACKANGAGCLLVWDEMGYADHPCADCDTKRWIRAAWRMTTSTSHGRPWEKIRGNI